MPQIVIMLFEFTVQGPPVSLQAKNRAALQAWKIKVRNRAISIWPQGVKPVSCPVRFKVIYYHESAPLDVDNMIKPIQDALIGIVYCDDNQVVETEGKRRDINGAFRIKGISPVLAEAFSEGKEFIHVLVSDSINFEELG
jgi:Holliday junction resolvase RusA-like endonuclease